MDSALAPFRPISDIELEQISRDLPFVRMERSADGELIISPPTFSRVARGKGELFFQLTNWADRDGGGIACPANMGIRFRDTSVFAPDASWISSELWTTLPDAAQRDDFLCVAPEVVFELLSEYDNPVKIRTKAESYLANGVKLVVLLDPRSRSAELHRPGGAIEPHRKVEVLALDPELPGFTLDVKAVFDLTKIQRHQRAHRDAQEPSRSRRA